MSKVRVLFDDDDDDLSRDPHFYHPQPGEEYPAVRITEDRIEVGCNLEEFREWKAARNRK